MAQVGILNAYGSTVGDNLEHHLISELIKARGHKVQHLWNFNRQRPWIIQKYQGLVVGGGGILWKGSSLRDWFFVTVMALAKKGIGLSIGYNQHTPLEGRWIAAVNNLEVVTARDPYTMKWLTENTGTKAISANSIAWLYEPPKHGENTSFDLGLIYNRKAWLMNYKMDHPLRLLPGLKGLKLLEIPFAQPLEQPFLKAIHNPTKKAGIASMSIRKCKAVLTARLHGFILALLAGRPAICIDDRFKILGQTSLCKYPLISDIEGFRRLETQDWLDLIEHAQDLPLCDYVTRMRTLARIHERELDAWLKTL